MRRKISYGILLICIIIMTISLVGCKDVRMPLRQGSNVFNIASEELDGTKVYTFSSYDEFKKSDFADMTLGSCNEIAKKSYYSNMYFKENNLILAKFNMDMSSSVIIKSITENKGTYTIHLVANKGNDNGKQKTMLCSIEQKKDKDIKGAKVDIDIEYLKPLNNMFDVGKYSNAAMFFCNSGNDSDIPLLACTIDSMEELNERKPFANDVTKQVLALFDDKFFEDNFILMVDYVNKAYGSFATFTFDDDKLIIDSYSTENYQYSDTKERVVKYFAIPRTANISTVTLNDYWTQNVGSNKGPKVTSVTIA